MKGGIKAPAAIDLSSSVSAAVTEGGLGPRRPSRITAIPLVGSDPAEDEKKARQQFEASVKQQVLGISSALVSTAASDSGDAQRTMEEDAMSLWQLLVMQHNIEEEVREHDTVRLDPIKLIRKVSPETANILAGSGGGGGDGRTSKPSKFFDIKALVDLVDIRRTATDDHAISPCKAFCDRLEFFRRFATGYREKFLRWEILRISMLVGFHTDAVLVDKRAGRELVIPLRMSRVTTKIPESYTIRMTMLNDRLFVDRVMGLYQQLTLTRGPITRSVYFALYRTFIGCMLLHLTEVDIHRLATLDFDVDCAEFLARRKLQAMADEEDGVLRSEGTGGIAAEGPPLPLKRRSTFKIGSSGSSAPSPTWALPFAEDSEHKSFTPFAAQAESPTPVAQPAAGASFFSRKQSMRSVATLRSWLAEQGQTSAEDAELDPVVMGSVDFVRWVASLVLIWLETHAVSDVNGLFDAIAHLWLTEADRIDIEFADRYVSKAKATEPSTVPQVPPAVCHSDPQLLRYVKRHMITTIKARFPKFIASDVEHVPKFSEPLHLTSSEDSAALLAQNLHHHGSPDRPGSNASSHGSDSSGSSTGGRNALRRRRSSIRAPAEGWPFVVCPSKVVEGQRVSQVNDLREAAMEAARQHQKPSTTATVVHATTPAGPQPIGRRGTTVMFSPDLHESSPEMVQSIVLDRSGMLLGGGGVGSSTFATGTGGGASPSTLDAFSAFGSSGLHTEGAGPNATRCNGKRGSDGRVRGTTLMNLKQQHEQHLPSLSQRGRSSAASGARGREYPSTLVRSVAYCASIPRRNVLRLAGAASHSLDFGDALPVWARQRGTEDELLRDGTSATAIFRSNENGGGGGMHNSIRVAQSLAFSNSLDSSVRLGQGVAGEDTPASLKAGPPVSSDAHSALLRSALQQQRCPSDASERRSQSVPLVAGPSDELVALVRKPYLSGSGAARKQAPVYRLR